MVEDLFELAQLEAKETQPEREPMAIAELVQDVVQKFQLRSQQAGITLQWQPPSQPLFVMADFAGIAYSKVAVAAVIPAVLYFLALYVDINSGTIPNIL